jgi:hypothetical protein
LQEAEGEGETDLVSRLILRNIHNVVLTILSSLDSVQLLAARDVHPIWRDFIGERKPSTRSDELKLGILYKFT